MPRQALPLVLALLLVACKPEPLPATPTRTPAATATRAPERAPATTPRTVATPTPIAVVTPAPTVVRGAASTPTLVPLRGDVGEQVCYAVWRPGYDIRTGCTRYGEAPPDWYIEHMRELGMP